MCLPLSQVLDFFRAGLRAYDMTHRMPFAGGPVGKIVDEAQHGCQIAEGGKFRIEFRRAVILVALVNICFAIGLPRRASFIAK